ncbi:hypothetical protein PT974_12408 [Cladobotryum mycophilum]|uniref:Transposase IS30-like HTH domain-containing protein n=1 Tax=Cladobotryum mycophilum TaxID=491253 RepID=A0ABR0S9D5_9HYPO
MSERQSIGAEISQDRKKNCEFTTVHKAAMCVEIAVGKSFRAVGKDFGTTHSTVYNIYNRWKEKSLERKPRSGRPRTSTRRRPSKAKA